MLTWPNGVVLDSSLNRRAHFACAAVRPVKNCVIPKTHYSKPTRLKRCVVPTVTPDVLSDLLKPELATHVKLCRQPAQITAMPERAVDKHR